MVGMREWEWSVDLRDYHRAAEYLSGWKEAIRTYYLRTGQYYEEKRFEARYGLPIACDLDKRRAASGKRLNAIPSQPAPHARHKEDVPHEGSLPDLYGLRSA
jgi:hypothetical protein